MAGPAKLEILTRKSGEAGFSVREIQSSQAYLHFRPERIHDAEWELRPQPKAPDGSQAYILRGLAGNRYLLLTDAERFLWERFDGRRSMSDVAREFFFEFGSFDFSIIRQFVAKLHQVGLLKLSSVSTLRKHLATRRGRWWARALEMVLRGLDRISFRLPNADRYCTALYRRGGFLLVGPAAFWISVGLSLGAAFSLFRLFPHAKSFAVLLGKHPWATSGLMVGTVIVVSSVHVLVHALACKAHGRKVHEVGFFLLQGVLPTFYADVTDIFMASRKARVMVALAGPMVDVVVGALAFLGALWIGPGMGQALLFAVGVLEWETALLNLYPFNFLELDGYHILVDLLAMPTLRQQAWAHLSALPGRLRAGGRLTRPEWIEIGYLALCALSILTYVVTHLGAIGVTAARGQ
jgi:putative peptide zinc metalloprotease protein